MAPRTNVKFAAAGAGNTAAVVGIVAIVSMTLAMVLAIVAMVTLAMLIMGVVGVVALLINAGLRYQAFRSDSAAALAIWRHELRLGIAKAETPELKLALEADLADGIDGRTALAMRRLQRAPLAGGLRTGATSTGFPRPTLTWQPR